MGLGKFRQDLSSHPLAEHEDSALAKAMLTRENTARPLGDKSFVQRIAAPPGRDLTKKKPGTKPKKERKW